MKTYDITIHLSLVDMDPNATSQTALVDSVLENVAELLRRRLGDNTAIAVSAPAVSIIDRDKLPRPTCACGR